MKEIKNIIEKEILKYLLEIKYIDNIDPIKNPAGYLLNLWKRMSLVSGAETGDWWDATKYFQEDIEYFKKAILSIDPAIDGVLLYTSMGSGKNRIDSANISNVKSGSSLNMLDISIETKFAIFTVILSDKEIKVFYNNNRTNEQDRFAVDLDLRELNMIFNAIYEQIKEASWSAKNIPSRAANTNRENPNRRL